MILHWAGATSSPPDRQIRPDGERTRRHTRHSSRRAASHFEDCPAALRRWHRMFVLDSGLPGCTFRKRSRQVGKSEFCENKRYVRFRLPTRRIHRGRFAGHRDPLPNHDLAIPHRRPGSSSIPSSTTPNWDGTGHRRCGGRSPSTTAAWCSPPRTASSSPEPIPSHSLSSTRITGCQCGTHWVSVRKDAAHNFSVCGVERIDDVGFDSPTRGNIEAVLPGPLPDCLQLLR